MQFYVQKLDFRYANVDHALNFDFYIELENEMKITVFWACPQTLVIDTKTLV